MHRYRKSDVNLNSRKRNLKRSMTDTESISAKVNKLFDDWEKLKGKSSGEETKSSSKRLAEMIKKSSIAPQTFESAQKTSNIIYKKPGKVANPAYRPNMDLLLDKFKRFHEELNKNLPASKEDTNHKSIRSIFAPRRSFPGNHITN